MEYVKLCDYPMYKLEIDLLNIALCINGNAETLLIGHRKKVL